MHFYDIITAENVGTGIPLSYIIKIYTFVNVFDLLSLSNHFYNKEKVTQKSSQKIIEQISREFLFNL